MEKAEVPLGHVFIGDPRIHEGKKRILEAIAEYRSHITKVMPSQEKTLKAIAEKIAAVRGREFFYPAIGSGIGNGPLVELADGSVKFDLINGIGVSFFGHSDLDLIETALTAAMKDIVMQGNLQPNKEYLDLLQILLEKAPSCFKYGWLCLSGSMANENAIKLVRQKKSPAHIIVSFENGFAGRTSLMAEITDDPTKREGLPIHGEALYVPFYDPEDPTSEEKTLNALKNHIHRYPGRIAAFIFELVQGEGGFNIAPPSFFKKLMNCCKENGIAIWVDEVQTFGRTGELFAIQKLGLEDYPDVVTIGKMLQNCALLFTEEYNPKPGLMAGTFAGSTVSLAVGNRVVERLYADELLGKKGKIVSLEQACFKKLKELQVHLPKGSIPSFGGVGAMLSLTIGDGSFDLMKRAIKECFNRGVLTWYCGHGPYKMRLLLPSGCLTEEQVDDAFSLIGEGIEAVWQNHK